MPIPARPSTTPCRAPVLLLTGCLLVCGAFLAGCSDDGTARSVLQVVSANNNTTLKSDVLRLNADGTTGIVEDGIPLQIRNTPYDATLSLRPDGPFGTVVVESYQISFECAESIAPVSGSLGWNVPTGSTASGELVLVPATLKTSPPLSALATGGEILATARIVIHGHESTSNRAIEAVARVPVHFANWQDD